MLELYNYYEAVVLSVSKLDAALLLILGKTISGAAFLPGTPLTLLSGAVLGTFWGTVVAVIGNLIGATIAFLIARYLLKDFVQNRILKKYPKINEYEGKLFENGFLTVVFLRLIPLFPFNALNFILGVTEVKLKDYFWGTLIGIIPGSLAFVYLGESFKMLSLINIFFAITAIIGLSYLGKFIKIK